MVSFFILITASLLQLLVSRSSAAEKIRVAYVAPSVTLSLPWIAQQTGIMANYDLNAEIVLNPGSPRLVQSLIAGDVDFAFAGVTALMRARMTGAEVAILGTSTNVSSQKLMVSRTSKIRRLEDLKGAVLGVSQYGSEADTFARIALAKAGLKPDKDATILQAIRKWLPLWPPANLRQESWVAWLRSQPREQAQGFSRVPSRSRFSLRPAPSRQLGFISNENGAPWSGSCVHSSRRFAI